MGCSSSSHLDSTNKNSSSKLPSLGPPGSGSVPGAASAANSAPLAPSTVDPVVPPSADRKTLIQYIQQVSIDPNESENPVARLSTPPRSNSPKGPSDGLSSSLDGRRDSLKRNSLSAERGEKPPPPLALPMPDSPPVALTEPPSQETETETETETKEVAREQEEEAEEQDTEQEAPLPSPETETETGQETSSAELDQARAEEPERDVSPQGETLTLPSVPPPSLLDPPSPPIQGQETASPLRPRSASQDTPASAFTERPSPKKSVSSPLFSPSHPSPSLCSDHSPSKSLSLRCPSLSTRLTWPLPPPLPQSPSSSRRITAAFSRPLSPHQSHLLSQQSS
jgi:hypothetical protein